VKAFMFVFGNRSIFIYIRVITETTSETL